MPLMSLIPIALKDLLRHVPTLLFEVVSWSDVLKEATVLSKRLVTGDGAPEARQQVAAVLPPGMLFTAQAATEPFTSSARHMLGEKILSLYFRQVLHAPVLFLDLRLSGFGLQADDYAWNPSGLWGQFTPEFRTGLQQLYWGFYLGSDEQFRQGLLATGLVQASWPVSEQEKMASLLKANFGTAEVMAFNVQEFQKSFQNVFEFLMEKKVRLSTDFLLLGVMLVTLYLALEECGGEYAVREIFRESMQGART